MTLGTPYRTASPDPCPRQPAELVYRVRKTERLVTAGRTIAQLAIVGVVLGMAVTAGGPERVPVLLFTGVVAIYLVARRRRADTPVAVLRVENGVLEVTEPAPSRRERGGRRALLRSKLEDLANVSLDTRAIRRVEAGAGAIPALRFIESKVGPEVDVARIVFDVDGVGDRVFLTEAYVAYLENVEWLGKIRSFLRSQGWVPEDERDEDED
ncbi:MAG: hypothetical protein ACLP1X_21355 [Polyangiaceae bacterium]